MYVVAMAYRGCIDTAYPCRYSKFLDIYYYHTVDTYNELLIYVK